MTTALTLLLIVATFSAWAGWLAGRRTGRRIGRAATAVPPGVRCSCGHGYGTHEDQHACHGVDTRKRNGMWHLDPCPCRLYDGPEPLPRVWTQSALPAATWDSA